MSASTASMVDVHGTGTMLCFTTNILDTLSHSISKEHERRCRYVSTKHDLYQFQLSVPERNNNCSVMNPPRRSQNSQLLLKQMKTAMIQQHRLCAMRAAKMMLIDLVANYLQ